LYTLLIDHQAIIPILTTYPIPGSSNPEQPLLGSEPLPADYVPPSFTRDDVSYSDWYDQRKRGTAMSFELAGQPYKTGKQLLQDKKDKKTREQDLTRENTVEANPGEHSGKTQAVKNGREDDIGVGPSGMDDKEEVIVERDYWRPLGEYDNTEGDRLVKTADLKGMMGKWGSRLRLRCTDDEIYYRLTGSYQKVSWPASLNESS
jgi:hypothetical protein